MYLFSVAREATPIKQIIRFTAFCQLFQLGQFKLKFPPSPKSNHHIIQLQIYKINLSQQEKI
jgi:hypothetical protein